MKSTADRISDIVAEQFVTRGFTLQSDLHSHLGADSLDLIDLTNSIEREFAITISDEDSANCHTVGDWVILVDRLKEIAE